VIVYLLDNKPAWRRLLRAGTRNYLKFQIILDYQLYYVFIICKKKTIFVIIDMKRNQ